MDTPKKKVLIVEDEAPILNGIADKFEFSGFTTLKAHNGKEGLEQALANHPDITLLDFRMPNFDGFYLLENLRKDEWGKTAKAMMWSNSHSTGTVERAKNYAVVDFLVKSDWEYRDVVKRVREILGM